MLILFQNGTGSDMYLNDFLFLGVLYPWLRPINRADALCLRLRPLRADILCLRLRPLSRLQFYQVGGGLGTVLSGTPPCVRRGGWGRRLRLL